MNEKRQEYLKKWRKEHGMDYYNNNKEKILKKQRNKREEEKGKKLREYKKINLKEMSEEERKEYNRQKVRESRQRKKELDNMIKSLEELGYWLDCENFNMCIWVNDYNEVIKFDKEYKKFYKAVDNELFGYITIQELQAINEKCKELKWI